MILAVYVDDIILTETDSDEISALNSFLRQQFRIKDLGLLAIYWGLRFYILLLGSSYIKKSSLMICCLSFIVQISSVLCPLDLNVKLKANKGDPLPKPELYISLIGTLNFLTHTRPNISYAVQ